MQIHIKLIHSPERNITPDHALSSPCKSNKDRNSRNDRNGKKARALPGSTLLETVTASLLFLLVFTVSLETLVRLRAGTVSPQTLTEADRLLEEYIRECRQGNYPPEEQIGTFPWGEMVFRSAPYEKFPSLNEITLTLRINRPSSSGVTISPEVPGSKTGDAGLKTEFARPPGLKLERKFLAIPRETGFMDEHGIYHPDHGPTGNDYEML